MTELTKKRPVFRNLHVFKDLTGYRLPVAGWVSILHRASGALMFVLLPLIVWLFDVSVTSEISFERFVAVFSVGLGFISGGVFKCLLLVLIWAYLHHLIAGVRHLCMDALHTVGRAFGRVSAIATLGLSLTLTAALGAKLFGLY